MTGKGTHSEDNLLELPRSLAPLLLGWYDENARPLPWRRDHDPYRVWVSEIMLQQTGAEVVTRYYARFLDALPTLAELAEADEAKLIKLWEGLGYYTRARNMQRAARLIAEEYGGRFPETYEAIRSLPGVGDYTAGAIASICFGLRAPAVDGNVIRVVTRAAGYPGEITTAVKKQIGEALREVYPAARCGDFTQSLMELGAVVCLPNRPPRCAVCPVNTLCAANRDGTAGSIPHKAQKKPKKLQKLTVFLLTCGDTVALRRREEGGLLGGLWELPNVPGHLGEADAMAQAARWEARPAGLLSSSARSHIFTHIRWDMLCYSIACRETPPAFTWVGRAALRDAVALPTAFKKFLDTE